MFSSLATTLRQNESGWKEARAVCFFPAASLRAALLPKDNSLFVYANPAGAPRRPLCRSDFSATDRACQVLDTVCRDYFLTNFISLPAAFFSISECADRCVLV